MRWGSQQGLRCGEASPNQGLGGTSGQRPNADSQRQPDKESSEMWGGELKQREQCRSTERGGGPQRGDMAVEEGAHDDTVVGGCKSCTAMHRY